MSWKHKDPSEWNDKDCYMYHYQVVEGVEHIEDIDEDFTPHYFKENDEQWCERNPCWRER